MTDFNVTFLGGVLDGQNRCPVNESEVNSLGYRIQVKTIAVANELAFLIAVPVGLPAEEGHSLVLQTYGKRK